VNPPRVKRQFRDPYGDWWDKQERRNYGEPIHEDNDLLAQFTPHEYTHMRSGQAFFLVGCFVAAVLGLAGVTSLYYPDKPSVPKTYEDGLEKELGGEGALRVSD
jgi:NADH dehydrogenase (ubiquinone) 1 beta subcomplex subunit 8